MMYLKDLGFEEDIINDMCKNLPQIAVAKLEEHQELVTTNLQYLIDLGVTNYVDAFVKFYNMFLMDHQTFDDVFSKYDREDLIAKLEKNVAIMEYL